MSVDLEERQSIELGLRQFAKLVEEDGHSRWQILLSKDSPHPAHALIRSNWLRIQTKLTHRLKKDNLEDWFRLNADLPAGLKIGIHPHEKRLYLMTEVFVDLHQNIESVVASSTQSLQKFELSCMDPSLDNMHSRVRQLADICNSSTPTQFDDIPANLERLAHTAKQCRLNASLRDKKVQIDLTDPTGLPIQLWLEIGDHPGALLWCPINAIAESSGPETVDVRAATSLFLLMAGYSIRLARVSESRVNSRTKHRWEILWNDVPTDLELTEAVSALSFAHQFTFNEYSSLCAESTANAFLQTQGAYKTLI